MGSRFAFSMPHFWLGTAALGYVASDAQYKAVQQIVTRTGFRSSIRSGPVQEIQHCSFHDSGDEYQLEHLADAVDNGWP